MRPPSWASPVALAALLAAVVAAGGCGGGSGISSSSRVTVYASMPLRGEQAVNGRDVVDGAKLALADAHDAAGDLKVRAVYLDDTDRGRWSQARTAANARKASEDSTAIAYIGDFESGATRSSLPVTNEAHLLQVSPASGALDLVQPFLGAGDEVPEDVQPTGDRTFGRVIPSDEAQAEAGAAWAKELGADGVVLTKCGSDYSRVVGSAFTTAARRLGLHVGSGTKTLEYLDAEAPGDCSTIHRAGNPVMGTDALLSDPSCCSYLTSAAEDPSQLPSAGQEFVRDFRRRYGRDPGRYAAYGYESMAVVLDSIERAGDLGTDRQSVIDSFFETTDRDSILGTYSIDELGNTTLDRLAGYRVANGGAVFDTALRAPG